MWLRTNRVNHRSLGVALAMFTPEQDDRQTIVIRGRIDADNLPQSTRADQAGDGRTPLEVEQFIVRWQETSGSERANKDSFIRDLCSVLGVPPPKGRTGDPEKDTYVFEADAIIPDENGHKFGKMDLYKQGHLILEAKQGATKGSKKKGSAVRGTPGWSIAMNDAAGQAFGYSKGVSEPPPFVIVTDIGYCFDLYACFDGSGAYRPFPNNQKNRLHLKDFAKYADTLRTIWLDPRSLDPATRSLAVTREVAEELAKLATELEHDGHPPEVVAKFLMRCVFTMFAEDIGLLREDIFTASLEKTWVPEPESFKEGVEALWEAMNAGKRFYILGKLLQFNGGLFADPVALALNKKQLKILLSAAKREWSEVEPSIFGTLIEQALDPVERHRLGAHFTPASYVERLLRPTIEEPLRSDWDAVRVQVRQLVPPDEPVSSKNLKHAQLCVREFQRKLCSTVVLDPACGSGNFLYQALNLFKQLESEVLAMLFDLGISQQDLGDELMVTPRQFKGIEVRHGSKEIAELVLWIGYLQWHHRVYGQTKKPPEPILRDYKNVEKGDAIITVPDDVRGGTTKNATMTAWPKVDFIVGNPPFVGNKRMRELLGDQYVVRLRNTYGSVPESCDYVMYWWDRAAELVCTGKARRFGFVATNSIRQTFNRRVVESRLDSTTALSIVFAVPDHPWEDSGAAIRVSMMVGEAGTKTGILQEYRENGDGSLTPANGIFGRINADLSIGANLSELKPLQANHGLSCRGVTLVGDGFMLTADQRATLDPSKKSPLIFPFIRGRDLAQKRRETYVIDAFGIEEASLNEHPEVYHWLLKHVHGFRSKNNRLSYRQRWWIFGEPRAAFRPALANLRRMIVTPRTAKHRYFLMCPVEERVESEVVMIALDGYFHLGILSSRVHAIWAAATGGKMGAGNDPRYNDSECFAKFPFPECSPQQTAEIERLATLVDAHRKERCSKHPDLTFTEMYNAVERVRLGLEPSEEEAKVHQMSLVQVLYRLHQQLDSVVAEAYGLVSNASDSEVLHHLVQLNMVRASAESNGLVSWLRPQYQQKKTIAGKKGKQRKASEQASFAWPDKLGEQVEVLRRYIVTSDHAPTANDVVAAYEGATEAVVTPVLEALEMLGVVASFDDGQKRWKGLARTTGERLVAPGIAKASSRPPPPGVPVQSVG